MKKRKKTKRIAEVGLTLAELIKAENKLKEVEKKLSGFEAAIQKLTLAAEYIVFAIYKGFEKVSTLNPSNVRTAHPTPPYFCDNLFKA